MHDHDIVCASKMQPGYTLTLPRLLILLITMAFLLSFLALSIRALSRGLSLQANWSNHCLSHAALRWLQKDMDTSRHRGQKHTWLHAHMCSEGGTMSRSKVLVFWFDFHIHPWDSAGN